MNRNDNFVEDEDRRREVDVELIGDGKSPTAIIRVRSQLDRFCADLITRRVQTLVENGLSEAIVDLSACPEVFQLGVAELTIRTRAKSLDTVMSYQPCGKEFDETFAGLAWRRGDIERATERARRLYFRKPTTPEYYPLTPLAVSPAFAQAPKTV